MRDAVIPGELAWVGSLEPFLDRVDVRALGPVVIGRYGGRTDAGATKNEDGALVWVEPGGAWEFATLLDAHYSAESAEEVVRLVAGLRPTIVGALSDLPSRAAPRVQHALLSALLAPEFRARCRGMTGEASCFFAARMGDYLWWLSIGDCVGYLLHPQSQRLGSFALNQRSFFEWVGQRNTFDEDLPCYTTGTRRLFDGTSTILLTTDGLLEFGEQPFARPELLYRVLYGEREPMPALESAVAWALNHVHQGHGRDSATLLTWRVRGGHAVEES